MILEMESWYAYMKMTFWFWYIPNQVDETKEFLSSKFAMKDMGEVEVILGIKIIRENKGI